MHWYLRQTTGAPPCHAGSRVHVRKLALSFLFSLLSSLFSLLLVVVVSRHLDPKSRVTYSTQYLLFCLCSLLSFLFSVFSLLSALFPLLSSLFSLLSSLFSLLSSLFSLLSSLFSLSSVPSSLAAAHFSGRTSHLSLRSLHQAIDVAPNSFDPLRLLPWPGGMREAIK